MGLPWDVLHFLRSLPRGEFLCEALHHWYATTNSPMVKMSSNIIESLNIFSRSWRWGTSGRVNTISSIQPPRFSLLSIQNWAKSSFYHPDEVGVWGVSSYRGNALHVPGQVLLAFPKCFCLKSKVLKFGRRPGICRKHHKQRRWNIIVGHRVTCNLEILASFSRLQNLELWGGSFLPDSLNTLLVNLGPRLVKLQRHRSIVQPIFVWWSRQSKPCKTLSGSPGHQRWS